MPNQCDVVPAAAPSTSAIQYRRFSPAGRTRDDVLEGAARALDGPHRPEVVVEHVTRTRSSPTSRAMRSPSRIRSPA